MRIHYESTPFHSLPRKVLRCTKIYSDNGTNFVGVQKELNSYLIGIDDKKLEQASSGILIYRLLSISVAFGRVQLGFKYPPERVLKNTRITLGEFNALLCRDDDIGC